MAASIGRVARLATVAFALAIAQPAAAPRMAAGSQSARMSARFVPERLGSASTLTIELEVDGGSGGVPSPLTAVNLRYPTSLGFATSGLGLATCSPATLELLGPEGCPANSRMGSGRALARFQIGPEIFEEPARLAVVAGPSPDGYVRPLVSATGETPVSTQIVMSSVLEAGALRISVPLVPGLPEGPNVAVVAVRISLGGELIYYETVHGRRVAYRPRGIMLPGRCPRGGFRFGAALTFADGTQTTASSSVRCPPETARRRGRVARPHDP